MECFWPSFLRHNVRYQTTVILNSTKGKEYINRYPPSHNIVYMPETKIGWILPILYLNNTANGCPKHKVY